MLVEPAGLLFDLGEFAVDFVPAAAVCVSYRRIEHRGDEPRPVAVGVVVASPVEYASGDGPKSVQRGTEHTRGYGPGNIIFRTTDSFAGRTTRTDRTRPV